MFLLLLVFNNLKCIKLSAKCLKFLPASNNFGVGTTISLFLCMQDLYVDQLPCLKQCVQINQPKTFKYNTLITLK